MRLFLLAALFAQSSLSAPISSDAFRPISYPGSSAPSTLLSATYSAKNLAGSSDDITQFHIVTSIPSINLNNVQGLQSVECSEGSISLVLEDDETVQNWDKELLFLVNPEWNCGSDDKIKFFKATKQSLSGNVAEFSAEKVSIYDYADEFQVVASQVDSSEPVDPRKDYKTGFAFDWTPVSTFELSTLSVEHDIKALCNGCFVRGNVYVKVNITKVEGKRIPDIKVDLSAGFDSNLDLSLKAGARRELTEAKFDLFKQVFNVMEFPGLIKIKPTLALEMGSVLPEGPGAKVTSGFDYKIPPFETSLFGGSSSQKSSESGFSPKFNYHPLQITPVLRGDQWFKASIALTPKIVLEMVLMDDLPFTIGLGIENTFDSSVRTGFYAEQKCPEGQSALKVDVSSRLNVLLGTETKALKPWFGTNLLDKCTAGGSQ